MIGSVNDPNCLSIDHDKPKCHHYHCCRINELVILFKVNCFKIYKNLLFFRRWSDESNRCEIGYDEQWICHKVNNELDRGNCRSNKCQWIGLISNGICIE